jgi:hypothetical protein
MLRESVALSDTPDRVWSVLNAMHPIGGISQPEVIAFLTADNARFVTGEVVRVDGSLMFAASRLADHRTIMHDRPMATWTISGPPPLDLRRAPSGPNAVHPTPASNTHCGPGDRTSRCQCRRTIATRRLRGFCE